MDIVFADRSERGMLRLTGPQNAWFLHQILTQAFEDIGDGEARDAAMITAHGRLVGYLEVVASAGALWAHFDEGLRDTLPDELRRYVFATQVEIEDVGDRYGLVLLVVEDPLAAVEGLPVACVHPTRSLGVPAAYLWVERSDMERVLDALRAKGGRPADERELESLRIHNGMPRWGKEMDTKTFPQEVGIDDWAVHYDKGCYVGQEAMAKIHFRGKVNRRLARILGSGLREGADVLFEGAKVGVVTSATDDSGLALVKATIEAGVAVDIEGEEAKVAS
ncbi:MAG TPA: hypothetical protein VFS18_02665 [Actinomycetota bacterium]|nr:hypothetical protein [Actinomycetota bacterium]